MRDIYASITERFIEQLKAGTVPWQRPWLSPQNIVSQRGYRGVNALSLGCSKFDSPFWMTFKQAKDLGGTIKAGEKSSPVIYYKFVAKHDGEGRPMLGREGQQKKIPFLRWSNVFNLNQTEGIKAPAITIQPTEQSSLEKAEAIVSQAKLCPIHHEGFAAAYSPLWDAISMPPKARFRSEEDYYHTLYHEMTHATGHKSRLNREGVVQPVKFGSERYSKEELIAELGAAFLSNQAGTLDRVRFDNSAAYLNSWMSKLKDDHSLIVSASSHAQRSSDLVLGIKLAEREQETTDLMPGAENALPIASKPSISNAEEQTVPVISRISSFTHVGGQPRIQPW